MEGEICPLGLEWREREKHAFLRCRNSLCTGTFWDEQSVHHGYHQWTWITLGIWLTDSTLSPRLAGHHYNKHWRRAAVGENTFWKMSVIVRAPNFLFPLWCCLLLKPLITQLRSPFAECYISRLSVWFQSLQRFSFILCGLPEDWTQHKSTPALFFTHLSKNKQ